MTDLAQSGFDYGQLTGADWQFVQDARDEIQLLGKQTVESICEIGRLLAEVKQRLPHGQWLPWLAAEFAWSERTAQRFMDSHGLIKSANLSDLPRLLELPPSSIADLAARATPEMARRDVLDQVAAGHTPTTSDVKETIRRHKEVGLAHASTPQVVPAANSPSRIAAAIAVTQMSGQSSLKYKKQQMAFWLNTAPLEEIVAAIKPARIQAIIDALQAKLEAAGRKRK